VASLSQRKNTRSAKEYVINVGNKIMITLTQKKIVCTECHSTVHEDDCSQRVVCEKCNGKGEIEIMGGSEMEEWGVIGIETCECQ